MGARDVGLLTGLAGVLAQRARELKTTPDGNDRVCTSPETRLLFVNVSTGKVIRSVVLRGAWEGLERGSPSGELFLTNESMALYAVRPDGSHLHKVNPMAER